MKSEELAGLTLSGGRDVWRHLRTIFSVLSLLPFHRKSFKPTAVKSEYASQPGMFSHPAFLIRLTLGHSSSVSPPGPISSGSSVHMPSSLPYPLVPAVSSSWNIFDPSLTVRSHIVHSKIFLMTPY